MWARVHREAGVCVSLWKITTELLSFVHKSRAIESLRQGKVEAQVPQERVPRGSGLAEEGWPSFFFKCFY